MKALTFIAALALMAGAAVGQTSRPQLVQFERDVLPFLQNKCFKCHAAPENGGQKKEPKGELRLDGKDWILRGGEGEDAVVARDLDASGIYRRVALPNDDLDFMPSKGDPLTTTERATLRAWIEQGAEFGDWTGAGLVAAAAPGREAAPIVVPEAHKALASLGAKLAPISVATLERVAGTQAQIEPAIAGSPLLRVTFFASQAEVDDRRASELAKIASHVTHLDLSRTKVTDKGLAIVARMPRLTRLDLNHTAITDRGLSHLSKATHLRTLNLYGTSVSDRGVSHLAKLKSLRKLYVWQTQVTSKGANALREQLPTLEVVAAPQWPKPAAPAANNRRRR